MSRTPDYVLTDDTHFGSDKTLPAGSFVRPIKWEYLPKHIQESRPWCGSEPEGLVFCYTRFGIQPIERRKVRRT